MNATSSWMVAWLPLLLLLGGLRYCCITSAAVCSVWDVHPHVCSFESPCLTLCVTCFLGSRLGTAAPLHPSPPPMILVLGSVNMDITVDVARLPLKGETTTSTTPSVSLAVGGKVSGSRRSGVDYISLVPRDTCQHPCQQGLLLLRTYKCVPITMHAPLVLSCCQ